MKPYFIGIAGGTGSGKSTFASRIYDSFPDQVTMIAHDNYYHPQDHLSEEERKNLNFDCPEALDTELLLQHLRKLKNFEPIEVPVYDFSMHTRLPEVQKVVAHKVVIVDGILTFHEPSMRELFDLKIYVDVNADERILRRIKRDLRGRGRSLDSIMDQYLRTVQPMHDRYVEPTKKYADIIINDGRNEVAFELIRDRVAGILERA